MMNFKVPGPPNDDDQAATCAVMPDETLFENGGKVGSEVFGQHGHIEWYSLGGMTIPNIGWAVILFAPITLTIYSFGCSTKLSRKLNARNRQTKKEP